MIDFLDVLFWNKLDYLLLVVQITRIQQVR